jgi:hypothetical protein
MRTVFGSDSALGRWTIDHLLECYISWRDECRAVQQAYQRWANSTRADGWLAYADYVAALDREEQAAGRYADQIKRFG